MDATPNSLLHEYRANPTPDLRKRLVEAHLGIAGMVARKFSGRGVEYDDLYQVASLALLKALDRFDTEKGVSFISYAMPTMVGEVKNFFRDRSHLIRMPRRNGELLRTIEAARARLQQKLGRSPTADELAEAAGASLEAVLETLEMARSLNPSSLDGAIGSDDEDGTDLHGLLGFEETGYRQVEIQDMVHRTLDMLPDLERKVIERRYYRNQTQRQVADALGVSQMTVSRSERRAIERMRTLMQQ
ncbi:MAG: sigma-70 family RNA polymerase sigma factor [Clostridiales bacterium]|nr:sigma-70 family RNA polymerase sigma factor [Clostridiales bacterium]